MIATIENMLAHYRPGVFAYSPGTGEEYSADPGDYWDAGRGWTMKDAGGEPMVLVTKKTTYGGVKE